MSINYTTYFWKILSNLSLKTYKTLKANEKNREINESLISPEKKEPLRLEIEHFINCVKNSLQPLVSGNEGKNALKITLQILDNMRGRN